MTKQLILCCIRSRNRPTLATRREERNSIEIPQDIPTDIEENGDDASYDGGDNDDNSVGAMGDDLEHIEILKNTKVRCIAI